MMLESIGFVGKATLAGIGIALVAGPLGSIIVWRRMSNLGDALGHSTLLGVALALLLNLHLYIGLVAVCFIVGGVVLHFSGQTRLANDTVLSILSQTILACGLVLAVFLEGMRADLLGYLYGDILAVDTSDLFWILTVDLIVFTLLVCLWRSILSTTIHEELARVEGVPVNRIKWVIVFLLALVFAIAIKLVGVLLIAAMLIVPAASARFLARTPEQMAIYASIIGCVAVGLGLLLSQQGDWPAGPAIVVVSAGMLGVCILSSYFFKSI